MLDVYILKKEKDKDLEISVLNDNKIEDFYYECSADKSFNTSTIELALHGYLRNLRIKYDINKDSFDEETRNIYEDCIRNFNHENVIVNYDFNTADDLLEYANVINSSKKEYEYVICIPEKYEQQKTVFEFLDGYILPNKKSYLKIKYQNGSDYVSFEQFREMYNKIIGTVEQVKKSNLSPLEQVMFVYDIAKSRVYKKNENNYDESCNLHSVVKGDYIVCSGYSNYIEFVLNQLGFKVSSKVFSYETRQILHQRNMVYINDEKYGIDNIFLFDATYDSKKNDNYLDNYKFFAKPCNFFKQKKEHYYNDCDMVFEYEYEELESKLSNIREYARIFLSVNQIMNANQNFEFNNKEKLLEDLKELKKISNSGITKKQFIECLYNVRKFQYEIGMIKKKYTISDYEKALINRYGENYLMSKEEKMLNMIFGAKKTDKSILKNILFEIEEKEKQKNKIKKI